jgi:phospholipase/carboxylesterase
MTRAVLRIGDMKRRRFLALVGSGGALACAGVRTAASDDAGRLHARSTRTPAKPIEPGGHGLGLGGDRDGLLYVPRNLSGPAPLLVLLHGASGSARGITGRIDAFALADRVKAVVLAPDSRDRTWDVIRGDFGPDAGFMESALRHTFARVAIDPRRIAIGGFSDGATYGLSLGLVNGDLFTHVLAFSPGFVVAPARRGRPSIFVSHGTNDQILPIDRTSRRLVPALKEAGYDVRYQEFDGPHTVPAPIARQAFGWWCGDASSDAAGQPRG